MLWLVPAALASLAGYVWYALNPQAFTSWPRLCPFVSVLLIAYLAALRGAYGTWKFPFWGFKKDLSGSPSNDAGRLALIWIGAVLFRVVLIPAEPVLSDDAFRYVWDGRVLLSGINPYRYAPLAPELAPLRDAVWSRINHPELPTIYPPFLMLCFAAAAWIAPTIVAWKMIVVAVDLLAGYAFMRALKGRGLPQAWVALYLWHPLVVLEFAGNGHADAVGVLFLALALWAWTARKPFASAHGLLLAGMVKFLPWVALPCFLSKLRWRWLALPLLAGAFYLAFWGEGFQPLGSLGVYLTKWRGNDFLYSLFVPESAGDVEQLRARIVAASCVFLVWLVVLLLRRPWISVYSWTVGALLCVSPVVHPWYVIWLLPVLFVLPHPAWWVWSVTGFIAYMPLAGYREGGMWEESLTWKAWEVSPVLALLPVQAWLERRLSRPDSD